MTDRIKGFYVTLEQDIRDDYFEAIKNAVLMIKGVISIKESIVDSDDFINRERIRQEYMHKLFEVLK